MPELTLTTADGVSIAANLFEAASPKGAVVVAGAMGVRQSFYAPFAKYLVSKGLTVLTFDYRGIGRSKAPEGREPDILTWARQDLAAAIVAVADRGPAALVGHSLGGQIVPVAPNAERLKAVLIIAGGQSGYWRHWSFPYNLGIWATWYFTLPVFTTLLGRAPMRAFGQGEDLPKKVALQWARWGRHKDYIASETGREPFARMRMPVLALSLADDKGYAPRRAVAALLALWENAPKEHRHLEPSDFRLPSIGHFGVFRPESAPVWGMASDWLLSMLG